MTATNWIADENKFGLAQPPDWWLQWLFDFDHRLVVLPSRKSRTSYLLAIRRLHSVGLGDAAMLDNSHPDTNMCYVHGLLPISPLHITGTNPFTEATAATLIAKLRARDTWDTGSKAAAQDGEVYAAAVEAAEVEQKKRDKAALRESFFHRGRDAWRSLTARTGARNKRASDFHGVARASKTPTVTNTNP